jgi:DNA repair protein RadC
MDVTHVEREGPRERLARDGMAALSDADLLALLLGTGTRESPVSVLSEALLIRHGGLCGLRRVGAAELAATGGIGPTKAARVLAAVEIGRRLSSAPLRAGARVGSSADVYRAFAAEIADEPQECFWVLAVDSRQRIKARTLISRGGLTACPVAPADVFRPLIREAARAAILIHNHPSGEPDPSPEDEQITQALVAAGELLGIRVLDHIILGRDAYFSFLDAGRLDVAKN